MWNYIIISWKVNVQMSKKSIFTVFLRLQIEQQLLGILLAFNI
jgi:hypothetical protein